MNLTFWPAAIRDIFFSVEFVPGSTWNYSETLCLKLRQERLIIQPILIGFWLWGAGLKLFKGSLRDV